MDVRKFPAIICLSLGVFASGAQAGQVFSDVIECLTNAPIALPEIGHPAGDPALNFCPNSGGQLWSPGPGFDIASDPVSQALPGLPALATLDETGPLTTGWAAVQSEVGDYDILEPTSTLFVAPSLLLFRLQQRLSLP